MCIYFVLCFQLYMELELYLELYLEMLKMIFQRPPERYLASRAQKCLE